MSEYLHTHLNATTLTPPLPASDAQALANELGDLSGLDIYSASITADHQAIFFLGRKENTKYLGCLSTQPTLPTTFTGEITTLSIDSTDLVQTVAPLTEENAVAIRAHLPFLVAQTLGLKKSAGCGDRLGMATPGHLRAFRSTFGPDTPSRMEAVVAQQSIRENARTGRTPQEVIDDAMWGILEVGWRDGYGADADHLKTTADIDVCAAAGYTFYTVDPGDYVDDEANEATYSTLEAKVEALPWDVLDSNPNDLQTRLANKSIDLGDLAITMSAEDVFRAAAKYGHPLAHTARMYHHLASVMGERLFELEMSVDETNTVTSLAEHVYIAAELKRLGIQCVSLAPRYVGTFEKGADYIGDLAAFEQSFREHLAVSQTFGPYKLSLHSGSDKFSIYPIAARVAGNLVHLKTAGTSYLEALRAIATLNASLFRDIVNFALERYPTDRASYHVSAEVSKVPTIANWSDAQLPSLLDDFHAREILHVTFGSVLHHTDFRAPFFDTLRRNEETYHQILETHFNKHFAPFL